MISSLELLVVYFQEKEKHEAQGTQSDGLADEKLISDLDMDRIIDERKTLATSRQDKVYS